MPYKEKEIRKVYFKINEVANELDEEPSVIRVWSQILFSERPLPRDSRGYRIFKKYHIDELAIFKYLVRGPEQHTLYGALAAISKYDIIDGVVKRVKL